MNPIKSHGRSSEIFHDEEIKFFSPLLLAGRPFITSSNDSFVPATLSRAERSYTPSRIITSAIPASSCISPLIADLITLTTQAARTHRFSRGKVNRWPGVIKPRGRSTQFGSGGMSGKNTVRGGLVERGRREREISRGIALNPIAVLNNRIKPGPRIASKQTLRGVLGTGWVTRARREGDAGIGNLVSPAHTHPLPPEHHFPELTWCTSRGSVAAMLPELPPPTPFLPLNIPPPSHLVLPGPLCKCEPTPTLPLPRPPYTSPLFYPFDSPTLLVAPRELPPTSSP